MHKLNYSAVDQQGTGVKLHGLKRKLKQFAADQQRRGIKLYGLKQGRDVLSYRIREISIGNPKQLMGVGGLTYRLQSLFLPEGFPESVMPDYLSYQLWSMPTHITGWLSVSLTTSSLLQAVGVSAGPVGTASLTAAFKWIAKDGIGAAGRLLVGGRLGVELDDDPRRYRMLAELVTTFGLALEVSTSLFPQNFLVLACLGTFAKAVGKGMSKPAFRVIQNHFARVNNVGAVAAKEEVWEVIGQLLGYASSLVLLQMVAADKHPPTDIIMVWAFIQSLHVLFRRRALATLQFTSISRKRACMLVRDHVQGRPLMSPKQLNIIEPLWESPESIEPLIKLGCGFYEVAGSWTLPDKQSFASRSTHLSPSSTQFPRSSDIESVRSEIITEGACDVTSSSGSGYTSPLQPELSPFLELYRNEQYLLGRCSGRAYVALKDGAGPRTILRAFWQAAWLTSRDVPEEGYLAGCSETLGRNLELSAGFCHSELCSLEESLTALNLQFPDFEKALIQAGWDMSVVNIKTSDVRVVCENR